MARCITFPEKTKDHNCQPRILYPNKVSFKIGEVKTFHDKNILKKFMTTKLTL